MIKFKISTIFAADDKFTKHVTKMSKGLNRMKKVSKRLKSALASTAKMAIKLGRIGFGALKIGAAGVVTAIGAVVGAVFLLSKQFSKIEDAQAAFTPLLGSAEKAKLMVDAINKTAATTPFQFENLADTVNQLLPSMNGNIGETIRLTRMLGDTAGGNAQKMESITRGYNKALIKGKVDLESLNMIAEAGVPIFQELSEKMGVSTSKLFKLVSGGKVKVKDLTATFEKMTGEGGIFFKGMEVASQTLSGKISTLKDNVSLAMAEIGGAMAPVLKEFTDEAILIAQSISTWAKENKGLIGTKFREYATQLRDGIKDLYNWLKKNWPEIKKNALEVKELAVSAFKLAKALWDNKEIILLLVGAWKSLSIITAGNEMVTKAADIAKVTEKTTAATAATSKLGMALSKIGAVAGSFMAGYAIGTALDQHVIQPMRDASDKLATMTENLASRISMNIRKMNKAQRGEAEEFLENRIEVMNSFSAKAAAFLSGNLAQHNRAAEVARKTLSQSVAAGAVERSRPGLGLDEGKEELESLAGLQRGGGGAFPSPQVVNRVSESKTTNKTEIVIKDETGRAEITKGKVANGLVLQQTGGMGG